MQPPGGDPVVKGGSHLRVEAHEIGAHYVALVRDFDPAPCERHRSMGSFEGWGTATDQPVALVHLGAE